MLRSGASRKVGLLAFSVHHKRPWCSSPALLRCIGDPGDAGPDVADVRVPRHGLVRTRRPGPSIRLWMPYYYGALFVSWIFVSIAVVRRAARQQEGQTAEHGFARSSRPLWVLGTRGGRSGGRRRRRVLGGQRLIIVARNDGDLYDRLRRDRPADEAIRIITDRRNAERRRQLEVYIPDRRGGERRRHDIDSLLLTQGWAEVTLPRGE